MPIVDDDRNYSRTPIIDDDFFDPRDLTHNYEFIHRPHIFQRKVWRRPGAAKPGVLREPLLAVLSTQQSEKLARQRAEQRNPFIMPARQEIGVGEFERVYSAAAFAAFGQIFLDSMVTIDFSRLGIFTVEGAQKTLTKFLKNYVAWARSKDFSPAYIYCFESAVKGSEVALHAHVALYVPGTPAWLDCEIGPEKNPLRPRLLRRQFGKWIKGYAKRNFGKDIPRAIRNRMSLKESYLRHWLRVTYLLKGCDRAAILQSAANSPDGMHVMLEDILPWPYCDPGPVPFDQRIGVSESIGPTQRQIGAPAGLESRILPKRINPAALPLFTDVPPAGVPHWIIEHKPFRSAFEDGHRDIRKLYHPEFVDFVIGDLLEYAYR